jgi:hypothetical protein
LSFRHLPIRSGERATAIHLSASGLVCADRAIVRFQAVFRYAEVDPRGQKQGDQLFLLNVRQIMYMMG